MQLDITGHQIDLTDALQRHFRGKMSKLERHSNEITHMHVVLNIEKHSHQAEATAHVPGAELFANADAEDMYAAIDLLADKSTGSCLNTKKKTSQDKTAAITGLRGKTDSSMFRCRVT